VLHYVRVTHAHCTPTHLLLVPQLLGELLLDRANFTIMSRYIGDPENLKCMMDMLRDKSKNIQFEAFHVFKVFVANPSKSPAITAILLKNKQKVSSVLFPKQFWVAEEEEVRVVVGGGWWWTGMCGAQTLHNTHTICPTPATTNQLIDFLAKFQESRADDEQFAEEKTYLIRQIKDLEA
jgi:calcium binding protein 39